MAAKKKVKVSTISTESTLGKEISERVTPENIAIVTSAIKHGSYGSFGEKVELRTDNNEFDPQYEREQAALSVWRILANSEKQAICAKHKLGSIAEVERQLHRVTNLEFHTRIAVALDEASEQRAP